MSAVNSIYHIVINTYRCEMTIHDETSAQHENAPYSLPHPLNMGK